jgi:adenosylcobyric acid synthase
MMFENIFDPQKVESEKEVIKGFGRLKGDVVFQQEKIVQKGCYNLFGTMVDGYEIHNATTKKRAKRKRNIYGTFVHGLFDSDALRYEIFSELNEEYQGYNFKEFKANAIDNFAVHIEKNVDIDKVIEALYE